ncbi:AbaSI family restriction endonuclease [Aquabacterium sp.]|uniref:AbaSI family restriction endonuclease n=1 Tax=Aquabacterium sp. TaxID=1872578 RepID=UPI003784B6A0
MLCSQCQFDLGPRNVKCRCGFDNATRSWCRPTTNETYFANQSFGTKRWESLVLHALAYALRDVHIVFQHHVPVDLPGRERFLIDAYFPSINLAVEVDEEYHGNAEQRQEDLRREAEIRRQLGCEFFRIDAWGAPVFPQIDRLVQRVRALHAERQVDPWFRPAPEERAGGEYKAQRLDELERAGAFAFMEDLAEEVRQMGFVVQVGSINDIPSPANGEAGFVIRLGHLTFTVNRRASPKLKLLVADHLTAQSMERMGFAIEPRQVELKRDGSESPRYWEFRDVGRVDRERLLAHLQEIQERHQPPFGREAA